MRKQKNMSIDCILDRRSVRRYTCQPVSAAQLRTLLTAAMAAPSAVNERPWEFVVVRSLEQRRKISEVCPYWKPAESAPLVIVVCGNTVRADETLKTFFVQDCSCASENILCAATGMGLGGVWMGVYGIEDRMKGLAKVLGLPKGVYPVSVIAIGHPDQEPEPKDAFDESRVHMERY